MPTLSGRILIVDDDPGVVEALSAALEPSYEVLSAHTGLWALEILGHQIPGLILLDYSLPDVSGLTILHILHQAYPSVPVILMTGFGTEDLAVEAFRGGVRDYLKKPISLPDLLARIESAFRDGSISCGDRLPRRQDLTGAGSNDVCKGRNRGLENAMDFIENQLHMPLSLDRVAREAGMSKFHFCRHFKEVAGLTFRAYLGRRRIERAIGLLREGRRSVTEIYLDVGFKDMSHFGRVFRKETGQSPSHYRRTVRRTV
jgi:YesN/AraC family two-component response regulator